jgi:hypothetical protein
MSTRTELTAPDSGNFRPFGGPPDEPVDFVWPQRLLRGASWAKLVYLDLNHWIGLADASSGRRQGDNYRDALAACRDAQLSGGVIFPLSGVHYMEIAKIVDPSRRANLATIMEELSGFTTLTSRTVIMRLEIESVLERELSLNPSGAPAVRLLGWGAQHSVVGFEGDVRIVDETGADVTERTRTTVGAAAFDQLLVDARLTLERGLLKGPSDDAEVAKLRANGWQPDAAVKVAQERADRETELVGILNDDPRWRRGRLRDVISAREVVHEIWDAFAECLQAKGISSLQWLDDRQRIRGFVRAMPSAEIVVEMKTARHRNPSSTWDTNTIFDIDAMALAVPYCDAVVTERHANSVLERAGLGERMSTALMRSPQELVDWLGRETGSSIG